MSMDNVWDTRIFYTSAPEEDFSYDFYVDINNSHRHNKSDIYIKELPKDTFQIPCTKDKFQKDRPNGCTI